MQAIVYTKPNCPQCDAAKQLLKSRGITVLEMTVGLNVTREELMEQFPSARSVPQVVINGHHVGGLEGTKVYLSTLSEEVDGQLLTEG